VQLTMAFAVTLRAPHGGIFVFFAIGNLLWFLVALAVGTAAGALAVIAAKQFVRPSAEAEDTPVLAARLACTPKRTFWRKTSSSPLHCVDFDIINEKKEPPCPPRPSSSARPSGCTPARGHHRRSRRQRRHAVTLSMDGGEPVDAGSALMIMTLGAGNGAEVTVALRRRRRAQDGRRARPARPRCVGRAAPDNPR